MIIKSQPDPDVYEELAKGISTNNKVPASNRTNYLRPDITDSLVYALSCHNFTQSQIAEMWAIDTLTLMQKYGDAYWKGHLNQKVRRRVLYDRLVREFEAEPLLLPHSKELLKVLEFGARAYEGLGEKSTVEVTSTVNAGDFKFEPLTLENKDSSWTEPKDV